MGTDSKWGDPRDNQIEAIYNGNITKEVSVPERRFLVWVISPTHKEHREIYVNLSTDKGDIVPDDVTAQRKFKHRCGLIKAINVLAGSKSTMTMYLDGFANVILEIGNTEFKFDPELNDDPVADIIFKGECTRRGKMGWLGRTDVFVALTFKDQAQMREFVIATTTAPDPQRSTTHHSDSAYQNSSSDSSLWPFAPAIGFLIGASL